MAVTVQQIFDIAIHLMDSQNESTGSTDTADTKEYKLRTVSLLNSVLDRAFPYSDNYRDALEAAGGKRPICPKVTGMADEVALDERICTGYEYAAFYNDFRKFLRNPEMLETPVQS